MQCFNNHYPHPFSILKKKNVPTFLTPTTRVPLMGWLGLGGNLKIAICSNLLIKNKIIFELTNNKQLENDTILPPYHWCILL